MKSNALRRLREGFRVRDLKAAWLGGVERFGSESGSRGPAGYAWKDRDTLDQFAGKGEPLLRRLEERRHRRIEAVLDRCAWHVALGDVRAGTPEGIAEALREAGTEPGQERMDLTLRADRLGRAVGIVEWRAMDFRPDEALREDRIRERERHTVESPARPTTREELLADIQHRIRTMRETSERGRRRPMFRGTK